MRPVDGVVESTESAIVSTVIVLIALVPVWAIVSVAWLWMV